MAGDAIQPRIRISSTRAENKGVRPQVFISTKNILQVYQDEKGAVKADLVSTWCVMKDLNVP